MTASGTIWHPFTQHGLEEPIPVVERAEGALLYTADGHSIVDGISSWWVTTHGHCHPKIVAAITEQAGKLDQLIFAGWTHQPAQRLAQKLHNILPDELAHIFFSDSGSTCVEVALKMALGYWRNRGEERSRILVLEHSYHGDTIGAMSVGTRGIYNQAYAPLLFDVGTVPFPALGLEQNCLDALDRACREQAPAAFIVEPLILGAGGMLVYPAKILAEMHAICASHHVLFIADEVMTGWGRTGTLLACEQASVVPDLLCLAKGLTGGALPLAITLASEAIYDAHYSKDPARQFFHSSSYTANPIACAAANANLSIWSDEPVLERIARLAALQGKILGRLAELPGVTNPRQCGTIIAFEIAQDSSGPDYLSSLAPRLRAHFREADVLLRPLGNTVYSMPPYCADQADLDKLERAMASAVELVSTDLPRATSFDRA